METWRLYLAINLSDDVRAAVFEATAPLRRAAPTMRWVPPEHLHLTMKFLGATASEVSEPLIDVLSVVAAGHATFAMEIAGLGAFPNLRRPRVVWLGVTADPRLELLHNAVETCCATLGHAIDGRVFRPHLTLGRAPGGADGGADPDTAAALRVAARSVRLRESSPVGAVDLMRSELSRGGVRYSVLASMPLAGRAA
jgi:RNA 2',3'-cyclic 3'-phosphodiesterase